MRRPHVMALAAGTVFELNLTEPLTDDEERLFAEKIFIGFGSRIEEGFGQLRLWTPAEFTVEELKAERLRKPAFSTETIRLAKKILPARLKAIQTNVGKENVLAKFKARLVEEVREGSPFENHLENLYMTPDKKFADVFLKDAPLPLNDFKPSTTDKQQRERLDALLVDLHITPDDFPKDSIYFDYLTNYFRIARKFAASKGGETHE